MSVTDYRYCLCCDDMFDAAFWSPAEGTMICPHAFDYRDVIAKHQPQYPSFERASEVAKILREGGLGVCSTYQVGRNMHIPEVDSWTDLLKRLMCYEPVDGAMFHKDSIVCHKCVVKMRKEAYEGGDVLPIAICPICKAELAPLKS